MPPEVTPKQAATMQADLPPAGHKREEVIAERKDKLAREAEELARARQAFAIDKNAFDEIREIQAQLQRNQSTGTDDYFESENLDHDNYGYRLVQCTYPRDTPGRFVSQAKLDGFEPVRGDEPNLTNGRPLVTSGRHPYNTENGGIVIGDCLLMRAPRHRFEAWERARDLLNARATQQHSDPTIHGVIEMPGTNVHDQIGDPVLQRVLARGGDTEMAAAQTVARAAAAKTMATAQFGEMLKEGSVPGAEIRR